MTYTELFFKFPTQLYMTKEIYEAQDIQRIVGKEAQVNLPDPIPAYESVLIAMIDGWRPMFSGDREKEDILENGFNSTAVHFKDGREILCTWAPSKFERELNNHVQKYYKEVLLGDMTGFVNEQMKGLPPTQPFQSYETQY